MQMEQMENDQEKNVDYVRNIVQIIKGENLQNFKKQLNFTRSYMKKIIQDNSFKLPQHHLPLQKKGRITHKNVLRDGYLTTQKFGQLKNQNVKKIFKPQNWADQQILLETKQQVHAYKQKEQGWKREKKPF